MSQRIGQGGTITLTAEYKDGTGTLVVPTTPRVDILDPSNVEVVTDAVPTNDGVGLYHYDYVVDGAAPIGAWTAHWTGVINGVAISDDEQFDVVAAGSIEFPPGSGGEGGPCDPWASITDPCAPCDAYDFDLALLDEKMEAASGILFELSGRRFSGSCSDIVRPCARTIDDGRVGWFEGQGMALRDWSAACSCQSGPSCGCPRPDGITLGGYPLNSITQVKVADNSNPAWLGGAGSSILDPALYRIDDSRYLIRLPNPDGSRPGWPCCQDIALAAGQPDTFEVSLTYGQAPPAAGAQAAAELACQMALACDSATVGQCQLPQRVQQIVRQGVTVGVALDQFSYMKEGRTGLYFVDLFLQAYNRHGMTRPSGVLSPDIGRRVTRPGT